MKKRKTALALAIFAALALTACADSENTAEDAYRQYGITCLESGKYEEAVKAFQSALDESVGGITEKELDICFYKAKAQALGGDTDAAFATYDAIIDYNKDARAYYLRGDLYLDTGDSERAAEDFASAVERAGKNYEIYIGIYESLSTLGQAEEGQKYLSQALEMDGKKAEDLLYKGRICYLLGDYDEALSYLAEAKEGGETLASYYMGLTYEAQGDGENAKTCIQEYIESGSATSYELYDLGVEEMEDGDYTDAVTYFEAGLALEEVPNRQNLMKSMIAAYEYGGDFEAAKTAAKEYLKLYPSDEEVQRESTFLETR